MSQQKLTNNENTDKTKRIASNTLVLFFRMLVITIVNLYTVRWVLSGLGTVDYGIFNAIGGVVTTSTCLTSVLAISTQRFYSFAIGKGDQDKLKDIFSVSINLTLILTLVIMILFETGGLWFVNSEMTIPSDRMVAANWIFQLALLSFVFSIIQIPFMGTVFAREHMGVYTLISTFDSLAKLVIAFLIKSAPIDNLVFYGIAMAVEACLVMICYIVIARTRYAECHYVKVKDPQLYQSLISFSGWTFYGSLAGVGMIQGSIILLNTFFGPAINAAFAISNQVYNALNTLCNSIVLAFRPAMIKAYSSNNRTYLDQLFSASNKALAYLLTAIAIPFVYEARAILNIWLGSKQTTDEMILFSQLFIIYTVVLALQNPITIIIQAIGKIKYYFLIVESFTIASVPLTWIFFKMGMPSYWIFISLIGTCSFAHIVRLIILKQQYPAFSLRRYLITFVIPVACIVIINSLFSEWLTYNITNQLIQFITVFFASLVITIILAYIIGINRNERKQMNVFIRQTLFR